MPKKYVKSWLAKQALWQVHIRPPKEIHHPHYDVTKPNKQHQFDLLDMPHNLFETRTNTYYQALMLHQDIKSLDLLEPKNQARLYLCWKQFIKMVACLSTQRHFDAIMLLSLKVK